MGVFRRLLPWFNEDEEEMKDVRTELAVLKAQKVESHIRALAESYRATAIVVSEVREARQPWTK